MFITIR